MTPLLSIPLLRTQSDGRLAALACGGHDRAFEVIVERYRRPLQRYLCRLLAEPLAEDVLQATFVSAWQALRTGTEVRDLRPWLYRIAHNQAVNALRAAGADLPDAPEVALVASPEIEVERREELRATLDGIGALPDRQRAALLAVAVADRPHADVAAELGLSDGALRQLLLRARTALRAAATAICPYPFMTWLAAGQDATAARVTEVAAGAGGAGLAFKAGAAVLAAGAVVAGAPALRDEHPALRAKHAPPAAHRHRSAPSQATVVQATPAAVVVPAANHHARRSGSGGGGSTVAGSGSSHPASSSSSGSGSSRSGAGGSGSGGAKPVERESSHSGDSGSGESDSHEGGSGSSKPVTRHESDGDRQTTSGSTDDTAPSGSGADESTSSGHRSESSDQTRDSVAPGGDGEGSGHD